ncbi:hypothetical protein SMACR_07500 [Sordaria macrospora]|uniref:WGS project CABT00000000 data, contig 2.46 n=2 Tax=Sordaria macrospora TaxID=5147 RepID=F7W8S7_SORMK|nr:uncharacterized protein SMAC_07500 [Sordaria macrospora k-hell]KAA8627837.1 hypothetical protein SMACR_07500 [Sordaria macrospora]WPJ66353.1 hypothetical protein SMAC4_07500 [Sordaria macrospora]CCC13863.1 unnamed protein product [Sordaria macrospora k-hell]
MAHKDCHSKTCPQSESYEPTTSSHSLSNGITPSLRASTTPRASTSSFHVSSANTTANTTAYSGCSNFASSSSSSSSSSTSTSDPK